MQDRLSGGVTGLHCPFQNTCNCPVLSNAVLMRMGRQPSPLVPQALFESLALYR